MKSFRKKFPKPQGPEGTEAARQRRLGKIVHDERGAASVEWREAPENYERPVLEVEDPLATTRNSKVRGGIEVLQVKNDDTFNPYERQPEDRKEGARRDLRKLSEYIKMMRELEERKKADGDEE